MDNKISILSEYLIRSATFSTVNNVWAIAKLAIPYRSFSINQMICFDGSVRQTGGYQLARASLNFESFEILAKIVINLIARRSTAKNRDHRRVTSGGTPLCMSVCGPGSANKTATTFGPKRQCVCKRRPVSTERDEIHKAICASKIENSTNSPRPNSLRTPQCGAPSPKDHRRPVI